MATSKKNQKDAVTQLRLLIREQLAKCNTITTPNICRRITTRDGYKEVEDLVLNYAAHNHMSVQSAISHLEGEL